MHSGDCAFRFRGGFALELAKLYVESELQPQFLSVAFGGVRQSLQQLQRISQMRDRLLIGMPLDRRLRRLAVIVHSSAVLSSSFKMHGQFRCDLSHSVAICLLFSLADPAMQVDTLSRWYPLVQRFLIQHVEKPVARGHSPVWPFADPACS